jgi:hypothetical protein
MSSILETFSTYELECRKKYFLKEIKKIENEICKRKTEEITNHNPTGKIFHNIESEEKDNIITEENKITKIKIKVRKRK